MVRAVDRVEVLDRLVLRQAHHTFVPHGEIVVAAQVVEARVKAPVTVQLQLCFHARHPCVYLDVMLVAPELMVIGGFGGEFPEVVGEVSTHELLVAVARLVVARAALLASLHTDVHEKQGKAELCAGHVEVIPERVHHLVGL